MEGNKSKDPLSTVIRIILVSFYGLFAFFVENHSLFLFVTPTPVQSLWLFHV